MSDLDKMRHEPPRTTEQVAAGTTPPPPPANPNSAVVEEVGSRALSDALRSSFVIVKILMVGLVILFFFSGIFTVPSQERAIILRFGKPVGTGEEQLLGPGLHWSFPSPIDEVVRIPIGEVQTVRSTAGWYQTTPEMEAAGNEQPSSGTLNPAVDGYTLTSDGNIIHVRASVQYRISEPLNYALNFVNASNVLQNAVDNAIFFASSKFTAEQATRTEQVALKDAVEQRVRDLVHQHKLGVTVGDCQVRIVPPLQVKMAFEQVSTAEIERRKARDDAEAYASRVLSTAQGEGSAVINQGKTDANRMLAQVAADAQYFQDQLPNYTANPELFRARLQAESMSRILTNVQERVFALPASPNGAPSELRMLINPPPKRRLPEQPPTR
ncbi:MAG TPA: protease modulator HflK [Candidatus Kapabacteria bacterium]|nr:protease modulator HflK [Candidatus Kapabacteria bacterium]